MSYLHCHTKRCRWSQDDFWHLKYNPLTRMWTRLRVFGVFSVVTIITDEIKNIRRMKWWTFKQWRRVRNTAVCPKCGLRNFDID